VNSFEFLIAQFFGFRKIADIWEKLNNHSKDHFSKHKEIRPHFDLGGQLNNLQRIRYGAHFDPIATFDATLWLYQNSKHSAYTLKVIIYFLL
jgi:hypothetical protein